MKILVCGGAGYIGSILMAKLVEKGYKVKCLDKFFSGEEPIEGLKTDIEVVREDIRSFNPSVLNGVDAVVNLAAISQPDPTEQIDPHLFYEINRFGCSRVARLSKEQGVKRYVFASTCSVYGFQEDVINEESALNPLEAYGKSKVLAERDALPLASDDFTVTILRFATVYGLSPKMRFDLVVNGMTWALHEFGKIKVMRDGTQWRPMVHVKDAAKAIITIIESDEKDINGEIFNVGSNEQNYQIYPLAKLIGDSVGVPYDLEWYGEPDIRSYLVDFTKIKNRLGYAVDHAVQEASRSIYQALEEGITKRSNKTSIIGWYKHLIETGKVKIA